MGQNDTLGTASGEDRISRPTADTPVPERHRSRVLAVVRGFFGGVGWILFTVVALVASAWLHVFTPLARDLLRDVVLDQVNAGIRGRVELGRIDDIDFGEIGVSELAIFDPAGRRVLRLADARVKLDLLGLSTGTIHLDEVRATDGELHLVETPEGVPSIAQAFEPVEPPPEPSGPGPDVEIDEIHVEGLEVTSTYEPLSDFTLSRIALEAGLEITDGVLSAEVRSASFDLVRDDRVLGGLRSLEARYAGEEGEVSADVTLALGQGVIDLEADLDLPEEATAQPDIEAELVIAGLGPADVEALGLVDTGPWVGEVGGRIHFQGTPESFTAEADLTSAGGDLHAEARMTDGDRVEATVRTDGFEPARVLAGVAAPPVSGKIAADVSGLASPDTLDVEARVNDLSAGPWRVPSLLAAAHVNTTEERIRIERVRLPYLQGDVDVRGTVGFDGAVDVRVDAHVPQLAREPNLRRMMPELRGALDATLDVEVRPAEGQASPRIAVSGEAELRDARVGPARLGRLRVRGSASGKPEAPVVDATVTGERLALPEQDLRLTRATIDVRGGPESYEIDARGVAPGGERGRLQARIARDGDGWVADATGRGTGILGREWSVDADDVALMPGGEVRIGSAEVRTGESRAHVSGVYRPSGGSEIDARVERIDVAMVAELLGLEDLDGELNGEVGFGGSPQRPELDVAVVYSGSLRGIRFDDLAVTGRLSSERGTLEADLAADLVRFGALEASASGTFNLGRREALVDALRDGDYRVRLAARDLRLALVNAIAPDAPELHGTLNGEVEASGDVEQPNVALSLRASGFGLDAPSELDAELAGSYADRQVRLHLVADDPRGRIADAELAAEVDAPALAESPPADLLRFARDTDWSLSVRTNARRLDELPAMVKVDLPALLAATAHVRNVPGQPPVVDADVGITWLGEEQSCAAFGRPRARARMRLYEGETRVEMIGRLGSEQVLGVVATAETPVSAWLEHGVPTTPPELSLQADIERLSLSHLPFACDLASGTLQGAIEAEHLLTDSPEISVALYGDELRYQDMPPAALVLRVDADGDGLEALAHLEGPDGPTLHAEAEIPMAWQGGVPNLSADAPIDAHVQMDDFRLEPFGAVPAIAFAEGSLDGRIDVDGRVSSPEIGGRIELADVGFGLVSPAQRFRDGTGTIVFHDGWIELDRVELHDLDGTLRTSGSIGLDGLTPDAVRLAVFADDLPIRQEGVPVGNLDVTAAVRAELREEEIEVWIETDDMSMQVARRLRTNVQQLEEHPDIVVIRDGEVVGEEEGDQEAELVSKDIIVHVDATDAFWVRRHDFAMQLQTSLEVRLVGKDVQVGGWVEFRRGYMEMLGKRFDVEEGRIEFLGGKQLNPRIDLLVAHDLASNPGDQVFIRITGHLQQPELEFSSTIPGVTTAGEVLALIAGGRGGGSGSAQTASAQAASALAGITAGILTLTARRELGDIIPDISIEATDGGARLRAGFDAERLIPDFLSGIVLGAYVEGFVGTESGNGDDVQSTGERGRGGTGGVLIELMLPYDLVLSGEVQPPAAAAAEILWEP